MTAFNTVRFRVKLGRDQEFLDAHQNIHQEGPNLKHVNIIKTGFESLSWVRFAAPNPRRGPFGRCNPY